MYLLLGGMPFTLNGTHEAGVRTSKLRADPARVHELTCGSGMRPPAPGRRDKERNRQRIARPNRRTVGGGQWAVGGGGARTGPRACRQHEIALLPLAVGRPGPVLRGVLLQEADLDRTALHRQPPGVVVEGQARRGAASGGSGSSRPFMQAVYAVAEVQLCTPDTPMAPGWTRARIRQ